MICLGSASPRRAELLTQIGVSYVVDTANIDETPKLTEVPEVYVLRMALEKAKAVLAKNSSLPVLAADTAVVVSGQILGKPSDRADGLGMLANLSGATHQVLTGIALVESGSRGRSVTRLNANKVTFRSISEAERLAYWHSGESWGKAGAYAIQGYAAIFVERLEGSFSGVMGLPLFETAELLREFGFNLYDNWGASARTDN